MMTFAAYWAAEEAAIRAGKPLIQNSLWPFHYHAFGDVWGIAAFDVIIASGVGRDWSLRWKPYGIWRGGRGAMDAKR